MARSKGRTGRPYRRAREQVLAASDVCWLCGHPGATDADHVVSLKLWPDQPVCADGLAPAHGVDGCPYCPPKPDGRPRRCNQDRGDGTAPRSVLKTSRDW